MAPLKESDARATVRVAVGDAEDDGRGFSVSFIFVHKGNGACVCPRFLHNHFVSVDD